MLHFLISVIFCFLVISQASYASENNFVDQILSSYSKMNNSGQCEENKKEGLFVFISFSMDKNQLLEFDKIAKKIGAKLVLRGFKNNSFKETVNFIQGLSDEGVVIDIDPVSFKKFEINSVPSFVLAGAEKFDKVAGNVSIIHALNIFKNEGELKDKASLLLGRL